MSHKRKPIDNIEDLVGKRRKHFVRYDEGATLYSMGIHSFQSIAKEAGAIYRVKNMVLVNTDLVDAYLETLREED